MTDIAEFDAEHPIEKLTRRQRAERLTSGARGADGMTDLERVLLDTIRAQGWDIARTWMLGRDGKPFQHRRAVVRAKPNWYNSIR
ncbi:MAG: hypothetical protein ABI700_00710 [Chloroflexota bacterium]